MTKKTFYERYWDGVVGNLSDFELKWPKLKIFVPKLKGIVIVDFGCGNGGIIQEMKKINSEASYIGLDVSQTALIEARKNLPGVSFLKIDDGRPFPILDKSVDFIFSSEVVEHIYDTENAFSELSRIMKDGGEILLTTPYHGFLKNILIAAFFFNRHFSPKGAHVRFFSRKTLFGMLEENRFKIVRHGYYGRFFPFSKSIYVLAKKNE